jgi:transcriptional regulator with XRE-family HTH domain
MPNILVLTSGNAGRRRPTLARSLSGQLAEAIERRGLSARAVAKLSGVDRCAVARFLKGERDIRLATADAIADALGLRLVDPPRGGKARSTAAEKKGGGGGSPDSEGPAQIFSNGPDPENSSDEATCREENS